MLPSQQIVSFQTATNLVVLLVSNLRFVYFRGHFISFFCVSVHQNVLKQCLNFEVNTQCLVFHCGKKYAHIWESLDSMQIYMLHIEQNKENIATKR